MLATATTERLKSLRLRVPEAEQFMAEQFMAVLRERYGVRWQWVPEADVEALRRQFFAGLERRLECRAGELG